MLIYQVYLFSAKRSGEVKRVRRQHRNQRGLRDSFRLYSPSAGSSRQPPVRLFGDASSTFASPRLRQILAALGSGYGLNEKPKTANGNSLPQPGLGASPRFGCSIASSTFASPRLRQSLAALGSGYGLNEKPKTASGNFSSSAGSSRQPPVRLFGDASSPFASPRLRQSLAALGSGYGLNEKPKTESLRGPLSRQVCYPTSLVRAVFAIQQREFLRRH